MDGQIKRAYFPWFVPLRWIGLLLLSLGLGGCRHLAKTHPCSDQAVSRPTGSVFVGGSVRSPGMLNLPPDGRLTLRQALYQAGGAPETEQELWVAVRRGPGPLAHWTYMPWFFVDQDLAGDIPVAPGDEIRVEQVHQTSLSFENAQRVGSLANGQPFQLTGWVVNPGVRYIGQPTSTLAAGPTVHGQAVVAPDRPMADVVVTRLSDILAYGGVDPRAQLAILKRRHPSGIWTDYFLFPLSDSRIASTVRAAPIVSGDELLLGPLTASPLLTSALVQALATASTR